MIPMNKKTAETVVITAVSVVLADFLVKGLSAGFAAGKSFFSKKDSTTKEQAKTEPKVANA